MRVTSDGNSQKWHCLNPPTFRCILFLITGLQDHSLTEGNLSSSLPSPCLTSLHCPRTHGHTLGEHCGCSIGLCPDTLWWPQHQPGDGNLHCSCTQPWSPPCTPCQTPFHSWGLQEDHRTELERRKRCCEHFWFKRTPTHFHHFSPQTTLRR